jgi:hypothetical protein
MGQQKEKCRRLVCLKGICKIALADFDFERSVDNNAEVFVGTFQVVRNPTIEDNPAALVAPRCGVHEVRAVCFAYSDANV